MAQFNDTASIVPITTKDSKGRFGFLPPGISTASFFVTGSGLDTFLNSSSSIILGYDTSSSAFQFLIPSTASGQTQDIIPLFITSSGINPRVGIGTTSPLTVFDFKDVGDSSTGTELLLRSSRTTEGAQVGDSAGIITFAIDSASFNNVKVSGSIATIEAVVSDVDETGVTGDLVLSTANVKSESPVQRVKIGISTEITGALNTSAGITAQTKISSSTLETSGFLSADSLGVGTTINPGASNLKVEGNTEIDGNTTLGASAGSTTTVTGSFKTNGTVYIPNIGDSSATDNVAVIDSGFLKSASVDAKIFANPNTLVSRNALGAVVNQIPIYTANTTILTGSNSLLFNPATSTLTAPGFTSTTATILATANIAASNISATNVTASSNISASGDIIANSFTGTVTTATTASYVALSPTTVQTEFNSTGLSSAGEFQPGARLALNAYGTNPSATAGTIVSFGNTNVAAVGAQSTAAAAKGRITVVTDAADGDELILEGVVKMSTNTGWSTAKLGAAVYMSTTAGQVTTTAPSTSGDYVRIVGHVISGTNAIIYFNPENGWIEVA